MQDRLKEDLKLLIIARREAKGQQKIKIEFKDPLDMELTPEELLKKERRREQNRRAAQRCRTKKRLKQFNALHSFEKIIQRNKDLQEEVDRLTRECQELRLFVDGQYIHCPCGNMAKMTNPTNRPLVICYNPNSTQAQSVFGPLGAPTYTSQFNPLIPTPLSSCATRCRALSGASNSPSDCDTCDARPSSLSSEDFPLGSVSSNGSFYTDSVMNLVRDSRSVDLPDLDTDDVFHAQPVSDINNNHYLLPVSGSPHEMMSGMVVAEGEDGFRSGGLLSIDLRDQAMTGDEMANQALLDDVTSLLAIATEELVPFTGDSDLLQDFV